MHLPRRSFCSESHRGFADGTKVESFDWDESALVVRNAPEGFDRYFGTTDCNELWTLDSRKGNRGKPRHRIGD